MNVLGSSTRPLFFEVRNAAGLELCAPPLRHGEAIRTHVRSLGGMQKEALVVSRRTGAVWRLASDEGAYLNGEDEAPCPLSFLTIGMVCSYMEEIRALARARGIELAKLRLIQDNYYTMQGSALRGTMTGGARDIELEAEIESPASRDELTLLLHDAAAASPLSGLTQHRRESLFALRHNDRVIDNGKLSPIAGPFQGPAADAVFEACSPSPGVRDGLIERQGPTPKSAETTGFAGSSLAEQQDRTLHVRGICTLRPDGLKHVEQLLFNPHGSIFHYLCEEAPAGGGRGRAPDALSYISAGIGFCFMTQLGRYASIAKKELTDFRILQDTHFSLGGASGGTGAAGQADPVETHVDIRSNEDDAFARTALAMSEQTCFLHALCRSELKTRIRISPYREAA